MPSKQAVTAIVIGAVFIAFGLLPGLMTRLNEELRYFGELVSVSRAIHPSYSDRNGGQVPVQIWWAVAGIALTAVGLFVLNSLSTHP